MAAHRYWRAVSLEAYGSGGIELSEFHLLNAAGARCDTPAILTASEAPIAGALSSLRDDDLTTFAKWDASTVATLSLQWDFGVSPADVADVRLAGGSEVEFTLTLKLQFSDDGTAWAEKWTASGITYPGNREKTKLVAFDWSDTFDTDPTSRVSVIRGSMSWSSASQALRASSPDDCILAFTTAPKMWPGSFFEVGARIISEIAPYKHFAIFLSHGQDATGFRFSAIDGGVNMQKWTTGSSLTIASDSGGASEVVVGALVVFRVEYELGGVFNFYLNGTLVLTGVLDAKTPLTPGVSCYANVVDFEYVASGNSLGSRLARNVVQGRVVVDAPVTAGGGYSTIAYATTPAIPTYTSSVEDGFPDLLTGVLGKGVGRVRGTVQKRGPPDTPMHRRVRLIREIDGLVVREQWSDPVTGAYDFQYVDEMRAYTVVSYDHKHNYGAVIADNLTPEALP